jgi:hypothetical protein
MLLFEFKRNRKSATGISGIMIMEARDSNVEALRRRRPKVWDTTARALGA